MIRIDETKYNYNYNKVHLSEGKNRPAKNLFMIRKPCDKKLTRVEIHCSETLWDGAIQFSHLTGISILPEILTNDLVYNVKNLTEQSIKAVDSSFIKIIGNDDIHKLKKCLDNIQKDNCDLLISKCTQLTNYINTNGKCTQLTKYINNGNCDNCIIN